MLLNDADLRCGGVWLVEPGNWRWLRARVVLFMADGRGFGDVGPRSDAGPWGDAGPQGDAGPRGDTGPQDDTGPR